MKKSRNKYYYSIGLSPNHGPFKGKTAEERIKFYIAGLLKENDKDAYPFSKLKNFIEKNMIIETKAAFWDMDTSVRDTFYNVYTNDEKDIQAKNKLAKMCEIRFL